MSDARRDETVVCNSGPLIALAKINQLELLSRVYQRILVPQAVMDEIATAQRFPEEKRILAATPLEKHALAKQPDALLLAQLGVGEAHAITLSIEMKANRLLIDEKKGRRIASLVYGITVTGTGGILLQCKKAGHISAIRPLLEQMRAAGYFLSERLIVGICQAANET